MTRESRLQLERRVLAALCSGTRTGPVLDAARRRLAQYAWSDAAHQAVFEIAVSFPSTNPDFLRELLPARLTRRGFPDFDFNSMFAGPAAAREEVERWISQLSGSGS